MKRLLSRELVLIFLITCVGSGLRVYKLTESPGGLYIDETSIGLNAYSIVSTGQDEHGARMPLFFEAFGEWKLPVYIYLVAFFQLFLGPTDLSIRLPSLLFGTLLIPALYFLFKEVTYGIPSESVKRGVPLIGAFILSVLPWHFFFSRPGFEGGVGLFFVVCGWWLFFKGVRVKKIGWVIGACISLSLALYTYNSARIVVPASLGMLLLLYVRRFRLYMWVITLGIFLLLTVPFWKFAVSSAGEARARQISIMYEPIEVMIPTLSRNFLALLSPHLWFIFGSPIIDNATRHRMPLMYSQDGIFMALGIVFLLKNRRRELWLMFAFLFLGLIPSAVTKDSPHSLRAIYALPSFVFLASYGLALVLLRPRRTVAYRGLILVYVLTILVSLVHFLSIFHGSYVHDAQGDWQVNYKVIGNEVSKLAPHYDKIYFADGFNLMPLWWYLHIEPKDLIETRDRRDVGKYQFGTLSTHAIPRTGSVLYVGSEMPVNGDFISHVVMPNGNKITSLWDLRTD